MPLVLLVGILFGIGLPGDAIFHVVRLGVAYEDESGGIGGKHE